MSRIRVDLTLKNETDFPLTLTDQSMDHGDWTGGWEPPGTIAPHTDGLFHAEGNAVLGEPTTGTEGWVRYAIVDGANSWGGHSPFPVTGPGAARAGGPVTCVSRNDQHMDVFWVGADGAIWSTWWDTAPGASWGDHAPFPVSAPGAARADSPIAAVARTGSHLDVFWIAPDGAVWSTWWDGAAGMSWEDHAPFPVASPGAAGAGSGLAAVGRNADHLDVFWVGPDGAIGSTWWDAGPGLSWGDHAPFPITPPGAARHGSAVAAVGRNADHLDVFWIGPDGAIGSTWWDTAPGASWGDHAPFPITPPNAAGGGAGLAAVGRNADHLDVFWVGPDGGIGSTWWDPAAGSGWGDHAPFGIAPPGSARAGSAIAAVGRTGNHLDVFWVRPDGAIQSTWWDAAPGASWGDHAPFFVAGPGASGPGVGVTAAGRTASHLDVFWVGGDGAIGSNWYDDAPANTIYIHFDSPLIESQYGNKYWEQAPPGFELSHTGGQGHDALPVFTLRPTAVRGVTGFCPSRNGFRFDNSAFGDLPVFGIGYFLHRLIDAAPSPIDDVLSQAFNLVGIDDDFLPITHASQGMCGGMSFAIRDYWEAGVLPPYRNTPPSSAEDPLFKQLRDRLLDSFDIFGGGYRFLLYQLPAYPNGDSGFVQAAGIWFGRSWVSFREEWPKIKGDLDAGILSPVALIQAVSYNPGDLGEHHQVLAYAYEQSGSMVTLHYYDPNWPMNDNVRLRFDIGDTAGEVHARRSTGGPYEDTKVVCFFRMDGYSHHDGPGGWTFSAARHSDCGMGALARTPDHLDVFWANVHDQIASNWWDGAPGNSWGDHPPFTASPTSTTARQAAVTAVSRSENHLDVFWIGTDGAVGSTWWDAAPGASWGDHRPFLIAPPGAAGAGSGLTAVARTPTHMDVFWVGDDAAIHSTWWDAAPGLSWGDHQHFAITPPNAARRGSAVASVARTDSHLDVFWIGPDGGIGSTWWDAAPGLSWGDHAPFGIAPAGSAGPDAGLAAIARTPWHLDVFWVGQDEAIGSTWWDGSGPGMSWADHAPFAVSPPRAARPGSPLAAVARTPDHQDVFWIGPDNAVGSTWWDIAPGASWGDHQPFPISRPERDPRVIRPGPRHPRIPVG